MYNALAKYQDKEGAVIITVLNDISYEITRNGHKTKTDMSKWYARPESVIRHIENDINAGYYPGLQRVQGVA